MSPVFRARAALSTCATLLLLLAIGCSENPSEPDSSPADGSRTSPRVVIIGVDGLEPALLQRFMNAGQLSNLQRLVDRGNLATIDCDLVLKSPVIWTTVATAVPPERHGILDFTVDNIPVTSTMRRVPALWNLLGKAGISSATVGWMVTWPAEVDSGHIVSGRSHWGKFDDKVQPPDLLDVDKYRIGKYRQDLSFLERFTSYPRVDSLDQLDPEDPDYPTQFLLERRLVSIYLRDRIYLDITHDLLDESVPEVLSVYLQGIDYVSHGFWQYFEPEPFRQAGWDIPEEKVEQLGQIIPRYYAFIDREIGRLVDRFDEDTAIILLSDHGFGTALGEFAVDPDTFLSGNHRHEAVLMMAGTPFEPSQEQRFRITHYDILPTILHLLGQPLARDSHGSPLLSYLDDETLRSLGPVSFVPSFDSAALAAAETTGTESDHDEEIREELRSLGYIE